MGYDGSPDRLAGVWWNAISQGSEAPGLHLIVLGKVHTTCLVLRPARFMDVVRAYPKVLAALYELAVTRDQELFAMVAQEAVDADDLVIV